jgi:hypothetical protein
MGEIKGIRRLGPNILEPTTYSLLPLLQALTAYFAYFTKLPFMFRSIQYGVFIFQSKLVVLIKIMFGSIFNQHVHEFFIFGLRS